MENLLFGIPTVALSLALLLWCYRAYGQRRYALALFLLLLSGLLLRLFTAADGYLHAWDERYHALVARNLLDNPFTPMLYKTPLLDYDYREWSKNHIWLHKQPAPLYAMALSLLLFGKNVLALRLPSILLSTAGVFFTQRIGQQLFGRRVGFLAAFLFAINGLIVEMTAGRVPTDHIDVFFLSFITAAVYFALRFAATGQRMFNLLCGLATGLAILTKWLPALIVVPLWWMALRHYGRFNGRETIRKAAVLLAVIAAVAIPWQVYIWYRFPLEAAWEYRYNARHIFEVLEGNGGPFYFYLDRMRIVFGELIYLPVLWLVYVVFHKKDNLKYALLLTWIAVPFLFFTLIRTKMQGYVLFTAPAFFILTAVFFVYGWTYCNRFHYKRLAALVLLLLFLLPLRYAVERIKPFSVRPRTADWMAAARQLDRSTPNAKKVLFNTRYPVETMFFTDLTAYETIPDADRLKALYAEGYTIFIDDGAAIPADVKGLDFVRLVQIGGPVGH